MKWLSVIFGGREKMDRDIEDELRFHVERKIDRYIQAGLTPEEARRKALERFGNFDRVREAVREIELGLLGSLMQDVRYGVRTLARSPGFSVAAVLSLALGIAFNISIFSAINAVVLRPLPYRDPARLVHVYETHGGGKGDGLSPANYRDFKAQNQVFEDMAAIEAHEGILTLRTDAEPEQMRHLRVSPSYFSILGLQPALGRTFLSEEDTPDSRVVVISNEVWKRLFGADPHILDREIRLNEAPYRIVGVMPEGFRAFDQAWPDPTTSIDLWLPYPYVINPPVNRHYYTLYSIARLKPGISLQRAQSDLDAIAKRLAVAYPIDDKGMGAAVYSLLDDVAGRGRSSLLLMFGAVVLVLLIACANLASLLMARSGARVREIAIRAALGAARVRLVRQLLTESVLLAIVAGAAALVCASWATGFLGSILPDRMARLDEAAIDVRVLGFTVILSLATGLLFGLAPAFQGSRVELLNALEGASRSVSARRNPLRGALVVFQISFSLVLLAGAGLMIQSFWRIHHVKLGFNPEGVVALRCALPKTSAYALDLGVQRALHGNSVRRWSLKQDANRFVERVRERLKHTPGVESAAAVATALPLAGLFYGDQFRIEGQSSLTPEQARKQSGVYADVSQDYFRTMGIRLRQGRDFNERDTAESRPAAVVSETMARSLWPNEATVVGKRFLRRGQTAWYDVVGVVDDVRTRTNGDIIAEAYFPQAQTPASITYPDHLMTVRLTLYFVVRTRSQPKRMAVAIRNAIREVDKDQPVDQLRAMEEVVSDAFGPWRTVMLLLCLFAAVALLLSAIGIYGVVSYSLTRRTRELGLRMALGAGRSDIMRLVMGQTLLLSLAGVAIGVAASYWMTRLLRSQLYGVTATDPVTFAGAAVVLIAVALLACYLPARRAACLDPMAALRCD